MGVGTFIQETRVRANGKNVASSFVNLSTWCLCLNLTSHHCSFPKPHFLSLNLTKVTSTLCVKIGYPKDAKGKASSLKGLKGYLVRLHKMKAARDKALLFLMTRDENGLVRDEASYEYIYHDLNLAFCVTKPVQHSPCNGTESCLL